MSQTDMNGANAQGAIYRADMNTHLDALVTNNSGGSAPSVKFPNMWWFDSISNIMYHRNNSNTVWLPLWKRMDSGWQILLTKGPDIASSGTLVPTANGNYFDVTGTTTVTAISPINVGTSIKLHFDNILVLNHSSGLRLPGAANITTQAGDEAEFIEYATGNWRCVNYQRADGTPVVGGGGSWTLIERKDLGGRLVAVFRDFADTSKYDHYVLLIDRLIYSGTLSELSISLSDDSGVTYNSDYGFSKTINNVYTSGTATFIGVNGVLVDGSFTIDGVVHMYGFGDELSVEAPSLTVTSLTFKEGASNSILSAMTNFATINNPGITSHHYNTIALVPVPAQGTISGRISLYGISNGG